MARFFDKISTTKHHHRGSDALHQKLMSSMEKVAVVTLATFKPGQT